MSDELIEAMARLIDPRAWAEYVRLIGRADDWALRGKPGGVDFEKMYRSQAVEAVSDSLSRARALIPIIRAHLEPTSEMVEAVMDCGPTNDEIIAEAKRISDLEWEGNEEHADFFGPLLFRLQADTSWFKPEPEVDEATLLTREVAASFLATMPWVYSSAEWLAGKADNHRGFAVIAEALAKRDDELTKGKAELRRLLEVIHKSDYAEKAPTWRPLDDLVGMVTQIDNMYAGTRSQRDHALAKRPRVDVPSEIKGALERLVAVIKMAGVSNLSNGVQLGQISWSVKCNDAIEWAERALSQEPSHAD